MTILFLIPSLAARGAERVLVNLVNHLDKTRYRITVQTLFDVGELRKDLSPEVEYRGGLPFLLRGNVQLLKLFSPQQLYRHIVGRQYDIVVAFLEGTSTRIIAGCPYADTKKVAWVHSDQHDLASLSYCYRNPKEAKACYSRFDRVVAVSQSVRQGLEHLIERPVEVLYNCNDQQQIQRLAQDSIPSDFFSTELNLVCVANLDPVKGLDRLIRVHQRLLVANLRHHIYLIGKGVLESQLRRQVKQLNLQDTFHFLGYQSNPYKYLSRADLYVCSSLREGLSTSVTEAMILGLPIVSTQCSGTNELLGNSEFGLVVPNTEEGLFAGLSQILSQPALRQHYRDQSMVQRNRFSCQNTLPSLQSFFDLLFTQ